MLGPLQARIPLAASIASLPELLPRLAPVSSVSSQREVAKPTCSARHPSSALSISSIVYTARHPSVALIGRERSQHSYWNILLIIVFIDIIGKCLYRL